MSKEKPDWRTALEKTRKATFGRIATFFGTSQIKKETWDELEAQLIQSDIGVETTDAIITSLQERISGSGTTRIQEFNAILKTDLLSRLTDAPMLDLSAYHPAVILLVGVNGSGKTTTAAKLGKRFSEEGRKVLLVAGDTFRAAATDQLQAWAERLHLPILVGQVGGDPGAAAYDGVQSGIAKKMDVILIDTAGRLHTRYNLMEELKKVHRVVGKALPGAPHAVWLVMDATTGQNALQQAKLFKDAVHVDGIILAKLDSSAKGGMVFSIQRELGLPILFVGLGERPQDLVPFDRASFVENLLV
jgi:fused signal recognition particle receptor